MNNELWDTFISRKEYDVSEKDEFGRVTSKFSSSKDLLFPAVSAFLHRNGFVPAYPDNKKFCVCLTHDVDFLTRQDPNYKYVPETLYGSVKYAIKKMLIKPTVPIEPEWDISNILEKEKKYDATSTFFFLSLNKGEKDFNYDLSQVQKLFPLVRAHGCESGLHGGHLAYNNPLKISEEKKRLQKYLREKLSGYRNHYLKFTIPDTWQILSKLNFQYDATFGFADHAGFRNGMCYPFNPYDIRSDKFIEILELPLAIMDVTLFHYMKLGSRQAFEMCCRLVDTAEQFNGVLCFLWHNNYMTDELGEFYESFLKYVSKKNGWLTSAIGLINWWKEKQYDIQLKEMLFTLNK